MDWLLPLLLLLLLLLPVVVVALGLGREEGRKEGRKEGGKETEMNGRGGWSKQMRNVEEAPAFLPFFPFPYLFRSQRLARRFPLSPSPFHLPDPPTYLPVVALPSGSISV